MKIVVITGSTRGIGHGLADSFLALGCGVVISGRTVKVIEEVRADLSLRYGAERVFGHPCDVTDFEQVEALWNKAQGHFGNVDIWINNAGISHAQMEFWKHTPEEIRAVVQTNLMGMMHGCVVALQGMLEQGFGSIYNMQGLGSDGRQMKGLTLYGSTKYGVAYLTTGLVKETKGTAVVVGSLSPGMVVTDLLTSQYQERPEEWEQAKRIFNILADRVETVTPWLAERVLANKKSGARIEWLNGRKMAWRFLSAPFRKRDLFGRDRVSI